MVGSFLVPFIVADQLGVQRDVYYAVYAASVLGLIGAGGIGYLMNSSFRTFQYQEAAAIVLVLIALVMLVDYLSSRLRSLVV